VQEYVDQLSACKHLLLAAQADKPVSRLATDEHFWRVSFSSWCNAVAQLNWGYELSNPICTGHPEVSREVWAETQSWCRIPVVHTNDVIVLKKNEVLTPPAHNPLFHEQSPRKPFGVMRSGNTLGVTIQHSFVFWVL